MKLVERIWARDASLWTGSDEDRWLGWLDAPLLLQEPPAVEPEATVVLLGMGGSSLAPEVLRRSFGVAGFHVLDTTHPRAIARLRAALDLSSTLFLASSKSGTTIETRSHLEYFRDQGADSFAVVTDPGSALERLAHERGFQVYPGEPTIGGRYSALSSFGLVPAALMGLDVATLLDRARAMREACRAEDDNPGLELGLELGQGWQEGRDKVALGAHPGGFGLWAEQLLAESTGKESKGLVPIAGDAAGADVQRREPRLDDPYDLGAEFFRWEFATAVAGSILGINPFDQPDVQAAKDRTSAMLERGEEVPLEPEGSLDELLSQAAEGDYVAIQAFVDPARENELDPLVSRARETGCAVTTGLGPRYLHSTGQLHKGGPNTGLFVQVVDELGDELPIPGQSFGFRRLISAQAAGDFAALRERGRRIVRVRLEDL